MKKSHGTASTESGSDLNKAPSKKKKRDEGLARTNSVTGRNSHEDARESKPKRASTDHQSIEHPPVPTQEANPVKDPPKKEKGLKLSLQGTTQIAAADKPKASPRDREQSKSRPSSARSRMTAPASGESSRSGKYSLPNYLSYLVVSFQTRFLKEKPQ